MVELLAPAGTKEAFLAAVENGANAVYLAGKMFGARAYASNFDEDELAAVIRHAHLKNVQVHVAVNTIVACDELPQLKQYLSFLYDVGADAVLLQDLGAVRLAKEVVPKLPLHASTQMTVHNLAGVQALEELGFSRVVLARELSIAEIRHICANTHVEIESFVHGALCVCYSGQCLMSSMIGGRSGNRGRCAQPCRLPYTLVDAEGKDVLGESAGNFLLSPRDLNTIDLIPELLDAGIDSLKIEGRMKSIHYVSTVTNCYKAAVDAYLESPEKFEAIKQDLVDEMWKVAQRELATGFYYHTPTENEQLFGARRKIPEYKFVAEVVAYDEVTQTATIRQRNVIHEGDQVEFYGPGFRHFETYITDLHDEKGNKIDRAPNPMELLTITVPQPVQPGDMVRARKEGLINLYKEDGTSVTVRA